MLRRKLETIRSTLRALQYAWQTEHSIRLQALLTIIVACCGIWLKLSLTEWTPLVMVFGLVLAVELVNTSIENMCDTLHPGFDSSIGIVKDLGASASFIAGLIATFVCISTFIPYL